MTVLVYACITWTHGEKKAKFKLHKNTAYYFEQILEASPFKTVGLQPFTANRTNNPTLMN